MIVLTSYNAVSPQSSVEADLCKTCPSFDNQLVIRADGLSEQWLRTMVGVARKA